MSTFAAPNAHLVRTLRNRFRPTRSAAAPRTSYVATYDYIPRGTSDLWRSTRQRPSLSLPRL